MFNRTKHDSIIFVPISFTFICLTWFSALAHLNKSLFSEPSKGSV